MFRITKDFRFESAQTLPTVPEGHKCRQLHGHSFKAEISIQGEADPKTGWVYDHSKISEAMQPLLDQLDHAYLNELPGLENPTIENMCVWLWENLEKKLPGLYKIVLHETPRARCTYYGPQAK